MSVRVATALESSEMNRVRASVRENTLPDYDYRVITHERCTVTMLAWLRSVVRFCQRARPPGAEGQC